MLLDDIANELVKALRENLSVPSKDKISTDRPDVKKATSLPAISVASSDFTFQDAGVGGGGGEIRDEAQEYLTGDGKATSFALSGRPIRPMLRVESPTGVPKDEKTDYTVDYAGGRITFNSPPPKGRNNVLVRYYSADTSGTTKYVQMNINYNVDVWASDGKQRDDITIEAIRAIALSGETMSMKGMRIKPVQGLNLELDEGNDNGERGTNGIFAKRLIYSVEANLEVKTVVPRIERIEIEQKAPE